MASQEVYDNIGISTSGVMSDRPPEYNDAMKLPPNRIFAPGAYIPPPSYDASAPQQSFQYHAPTVIEYNMRYQKMHLIYGVLNLLFGGIIMIIDPLLPALFHYYFSIFISGIFLFISGVFSIHASKYNNKCCLKASLTLNIFALLILFPSYILGIIAASNNESIARCSPNVYCLPNQSFYTFGVLGLGIFNAIFGIIMFVLVLWDSTLKCGDLCCPKKSPATIIYNPTGSIFNAQGHM